MASFKVHKYNKALVTPLGIYSFNLTDTVNKGFKSFSNFFNLFMVLIFFTISSGAFVCLNWPNLEIVLKSFLMAMGGLQYEGMFLSIGLQMYLLNVNFLHFALLNIVDEGDFN